jgi:AraC-like DNA-binding protein/quercetin dioxygenase-like cupin family protein
MSTTRQSLLSTLNPDVLAPPPPDAEARMIAYAADLERGGGTDTHSHGRGQLLATVAGAIAVTTELGTYVVPPERALWIPAGVPHHTRHLASTRLRTLYISEAPDLALPKNTGVVQVSPLLRCLIDAAMALPRDYDEAGAAGRLVAVLIDQIGMSDELPLHVPLPQSGPLRIMAERMLREPANRRLIEDWAGDFAVSARTLERRFKLETGMTIRTFRIQAKLFRALELLSQHVPVGDISDALGFEAPSTFIAMFRKAFGVTPARYLSTSARGI